MALVHNIESENFKVLSPHRYMLCDGSPDPTIAGEINAYISLWKEDETHVQVNEVLDKALRCLSV